MVPLLGLATGGRADGLVDAEAPLIMRPPAQVAVAVVTVVPSWPLTPAVSVRVTVMVGGLASVEQMANAVIASVEAGIPADPYADHDVGFVEALLAGVPVELEG